MKTPHKTDVTLQSLIADIPIAMLTTRNRSGDLHSRPMMTNELGNDQIVWFFSEENTQKNDDVTDFSQVNIVYSDPVSHRYVSLCGRAEKITNRDLINKHWHPHYMKLFPQGPDNPNLMLIKITPDHISYWASPSDWTEKILPLVNS
jgi:general stress protein 26